MSKLFNHGKQSEVCSECNYTRGFSLGCTFNVTKYLLVSFYCYVMTENGQLWVQQVSSTPATRLDVVNLQVHTHTFTLITFMKDVGNLTLVK